MIIVKKSQSAHGLSRLKPLYLLLFFLIMDDKTQAFYERLKTELDNANAWPAEYLFKFIVPTDNEKIARVESAFDCMGAVIRTNQSKTGKFTSISVDVTMPDADSIVSKYQEVSTIEGIISL